MVEYNRSSRDVVQLVECTHGVRVVESSSLSIPTKNIHTRIHIPFMSQQTHQKERQHSFIKPSIISARVYIILLFIIAVIGFAIRMIGLDRVPTGISSDTLLYFMNARAIAETGKDIYGKVHPLFFLHKDIVAMPLLIYVITFFYKLLGSSHIIGYIPNILLSTLSIVVVGFFTKTMTKKPIAGIFAAIVLAVSPWHYHLSRTGFEGVFAFTLILFGIYFLLLGFEKRSYFFWSVLMMFLATFCYKAVNIFLFFFPLTVLVYKGISFAKTKTFILYILALWFAIFLQWFLLFFLYKDSYASGILSHTIDLAKKEVTYQMEISDAPRKIKLLFSNTPVAIATLATQNYLHFFSPQYLFTTGDSDNRFSTTGHGQLYIFDGICIVLGAFWLYKKKRISQLKFLLSIICIAPLSAMIADQQYAIRTFVSVFIFAALTGIGFTYGIERIYAYKYKTIVFCIVGLLYVFSVAQYMYRYHFLYVHYGRWAWNSNNKEVFALAYRESQTHSQVTFGGTSEFDYLDFMYWNHLPILEVQKTLSTYDNSMLDYENIYFIRTCTGVGDTLTPQSIGRDELLFVRDECLQSIEPKTKYYLPKIQKYTWKLYDSTSIR